MDTIDKIYIINLDEREDRFKKIENELNTQNITNYVRFPAVKPDLIDYPYHAATHKFSSKSDNYIRGSLGCKLSHLSILKHAKQHNYNRILILEDDIQFTNNIEVLNNALNTLSDTDFILLYLSANLLKVNLTKYVNNIFKIKNALCAHSYIVNCSYCDFLIKGIETSPYEIDVYYKAIQESNKCFIINPGITRQRDDYSNILERNVSYKTIG